MWKWASGREIEENVDCLLVFSCSTEFFNNCQQSVVLRNSLTKKLFLMFLYLEVSVKKFAQHYFYFASSREGWQMASCRNFRRGIKTKLVLQFTKGARKCLFNLSNLKLSFHAGKSVMAECLVKANWHNPKYRTIEHKQLRLAGRESGNVLCIFMRSGCQN